MEKEAEVFGPRTISGFLSQVGAEEAMTADQVVWSEQGRLHLSYLGHVHSTAGGIDGDGLVLVRHKLILYQISMVTFLVMDLLQQITVLE